MNPQYIAWNVFQFRNAFDLTNLPSKQVVKLIKKQTCIVSSNEPRTYNYGAGTFKFHERAGEIYLEEIVFQIYKCVLWLNCSTISFRIFVENKKKSAFFDIHIPFMIWFPNSIIEGNMLWRYPIFREKKRSKDRSCLCASLLCWVIAYRVSTTNCNPPL